MISCGLILFFFSFVRLPFFEFWGVASIYLFLLCRCVCPNLCIWCCLSAWIVKLFSCFCMCDVVILWLVSALLGCVWFRCSCKCLCKCGSWRRKHENKMVNHLLQIWMVYFVTVCLSSILWTVQRTMIHFLIELLVHWTWFGQFSELYFILHWLVVRCKFLPKLVAHNRKCRLKSSQVSIL